MCSRQTRLRPLRLPTFCCASAPPTTNSCTIPASRLRFRTCRSSGSAMRRFRAATACLPRSWTCMPRPGRTASWSRARTPSSSQVSCMASQRSRCRRGRCARRSLRMWRTRSPEHTRRGRSAWSFWHKSVGAYRTRSWPPPIQPPPEIMEYELPARPALGGAMQRVGFSVIRNADQGGGALYPDATAAEGLGATRLAIPMPTRTRLAKLTRPATAATYSRTRLFEELDKADGAPVAWLAGPPGSGKTTLIADYTATQRLQSLWYQVDRGDSDIASFFFYLGQAVQGERRGGKPLPQFESAYMGNVEAFARNYFRDLYARLERPCLVFDNCQDVNAADPLYGVLRVAIDELPQGGRLFIISRLSPPAGFARLRARGRLTLIGWAELRLTLEEACGVAAVRDAGITAAEVERLHARIHGWAAGFILLLQDRDARSSAVSAPDADTPSVIFDYLAEEVLQRFKPATQEALLRLAYLPQITVPMADELGIQAESRNTLLWLAQKGFLVTVIPGEPHTIYHLHPLLREFLESRAEITGSAEEIAARKRLAVRVLAAHEHFEAAAALLVRLRDWEGLETRILSQADALLAQARGQTLENWISALPEARRGENPWLLYWLATARYPYAPRESRELYARAFRLFTRATPVSTAGVLAAINGALEATLHDPDDFSLLDPWIEAGTQWIASNPEWPTPDLEARLTGNMFIALVLRQPWHPDVPIWRERTQRLSQTHRDPNVRLSVDGVLITLSAWNGQFTGAERLVEQVAALAALPNVTPVSTTKFAQARATYYMLAGNRAHCLAAARNGLDIVTRSGVRIWNDTFLINALCSALGEADLDDAEQWLKAIE